MDSTPSAVHSAPAVKMMNCSPQRPGGTRTHDLALS